MFKTFDITVPLIGWAVGILFLSAFVLYIVAILLKKTKPNRTMWWIIAIVVSAFGVVYYFCSANRVIWIPLSYIVGPVAIAFLSLWYGKGGWLRFRRKFLLCIGLVWRHKGRSVCRSLRFLLICQIYSTIQKSHNKLKKIAIKKQNALPLKHSHPHLSFARNTHSSRAV